MLREESSTVLLQSTPFQGQLRLGSSPSFLAKTGQAPEISLEPKHKMATLLVGFLLPSRFAWHQARAVRGHDSESHGSILSW